MAETVTFSQLLSQNAFAVTLSANGRTAFVADLFSGVHIINVSNPAQPRLIRKLRTGGHPEKISLPNGWTVEHGWLDRKQVLRITGMA